MHATRAIRMPDPSQEEHYQKMLMWYTHTHEQPESPGMVRAPTEYEESVSTASLEYLAHPLIPGFLVGERGTSPCRSSFPRSGVSPAVRPFAT